MLIRRLSPRGRKIAGSVFLVLGAAVVAVSAALSVNLYLRGAILMVLGGVLWTSAVVGRRRALAARAAGAAGAGADGQQTLAGSSHAR